MKIRANMKELMNGDVQYVSLVDRAATRMPFRVVKQETGMINLNDLRSVFKKDGGVAEVAKPTVSAIIVYAQKKDEMAAKVRKAISDAGYKVETAIKNADGETITFAQDADPLTDATLVRLSDQMVIAVKGFNPQNPALEDKDFSGTAASNSFHQGVDSALDVLFNKIVSTMSAAKSETDAASQVGSIIDGFKKYAVGLVSSLPAEAFKVDLAVKAALAEITKGEVHNLDDVEALLSKAAPGNINATDWGNMGTHDKLTWLISQSPNKPIPAPSVAGNLAAKMERPSAIKEEDWGKMSDEDKAKAVKAEEDSKLTEAQKKDKALLDAINGLTSKVDGIVATNKTLAENQTAINSRLDGIAQKNDTLDKALKSTVAAHATSGDAPSGKVTTTKAEDDPRTGAFDTAFINRSKRRA